MIQYEVIGFYFDNWAVSWEDYQDVLISLNSLTVNYPLARGVSYLNTVEKFLSNR